MGTRYHLEMDCPYCKYHNDDVYYAPTCGFLTMRCDKCGKESIITECFHAQKATKEEIEQYYESEGFSTE